MAIFPALYAAVAFFGTYVHVAVVWQLADIVNAGLLLVNLLGLVWFVGIISKGLRDYESQR
jgi:Na+/alanine symporter